MQKIDYLMEQYKLYHGHINNLFNYFLVLEGLIANAYVVSITVEKDVPGIVPAAIAMCGLLLTLMMWQIHRRSRSLLDTLEDLLRLEEGDLFKQLPAFLTFKTPAMLTGAKEPWYHRHKYQFQFIYIVFIFMFCLGMVYPIIDKLVAAASVAKTALCAALS